MSTTAAGMRICTVDGRRIMSDIGTAEYLNGEGRRHCPLLSKLDSTRGQLEYAMCYKDGVRHGSSTEWYLNGQEYVRSNHATGVLHGPYTMWYSNGVKDQEGTYEEGGKTGLWIGWYDTGVKASEGQYVADKLDGPWTDGGKRN